MIFVSVGGQKSFPRLCKAVSVFASETSVPCVMQVGEDANLYQHHSIFKFMCSSDFSRQLRLCDIFVSHAGMGNILAAREAKKPIIIMPRRHDLGEHRNDHQLATARALDGLPNLRIAWEDIDLRPLLLNYMHSSGEQVQAAAITPSLAIALPPLLARLLS